jgi:hypothetical protein
VGVVASKKALALWWVEEGTGCEEFMVDSDVVLLLWLRALVWSVMQGGEDTKTKTGAGLFVGSVVPLLCLGGWS